MRVLIVGPPEVRARLRAALPAAIAVAGEYATATEAHRAGAVADAILSDLSEPIDDQAAAAAPAAERPPEPPVARHERDRDPPVRHPTGELVEHLTPREVQVLELLAEGLANRAMAERLHISDQTVKFHIASIMGKLGTANRVQTVRRAVRRGLITL
jgi:DNA-binding NarL/FixJ family response regulator